MKVQIDKSVIERAIEALSNSYDVVEWPANGTTPLDKSLAELRAALAAQEPAQVAMLHDYPILQQFHTKHALGSMRAPSCFCCGKQTDPVTRPVAVKHLELPGIVICQDCKTASQVVEPVAWMLYRPSMPNQELFDDIDDPHIIDVMTNESDAELTPLYTHPAPAKPLSDEQEKMIDFLCGAGEFEGVWFSENHPKERGQYWWRKHLKRIFGKDDNGIKETS